MKKIMLVLVCILILPITIVEAEEEREISIYVEYMPFRDIEEIADMATDIVFLEILNDRVEWINIWEGLESVPAEGDLYDIHTIHSARVLDVFQGDLAIGDTIEIMQEGGSLDGTNYINRSAINLSYGDNVVLFLYNPINFPFTIISPYQGVYVINDGGDLFGYHQNQSFNDLELTWDILEQIQYENGIESISDTTENTESNVADGSDVENNDTESNDTENIEVENSVVENNGIERSGVAIGIVIVGSTLAILFLVLIMRGRNRKRDNS